MCTRRSGAVLTSATPGSATFLNLLPTYASQKWVLAQKDDKRLTPGGLQLSGSPPIQSVHILILLLHVDRVSYMQDYFCIDTYVGFLRFTRSPTQSCQVSDRKKRRGVGIKRRDVIY